MMDGDVKILYVARRMLLLQSATFILVSSPVTD